MIFFMGFVVSAMCLIGLLVVFSNTGDTEKELSRNEMWLLCVVASVLSFCFWSSVVSFVEWV